MHFPILTFPYRHPIRHMLILTYSIALDVSFSGESRQASTAHDSKWKLIMNLTFCIPSAGFINKTWISASAETIFDNTCMLTWTFSVFSTPWIGLGY